MKSKRFKIVIFHQEFYFSGGAERLIFEEMEALTKKGFYVECWAPLVDRKRCFPEQIGKYNIKGFFPHISFIPRELIILLSCFLAPFLVLRFRKFDLFYGVNQAGPWFAYVAAKILRKPYLVFMPYPVGLLYPRKIDQEAGLLEEVTWPIRIMMMKVFKPLVKAIDWQVMKHASAVLTTGEYAKSVFERIYKRVVINAPSGADPFPIERIDHAKRWSGKVKISGKLVAKPYILITNRPMPKKKFEYAIQPLPLVLKKFGKVDLAIASSKNEYTQELGELAERFGVGDRVVFLDFIDSLDLENAYLEAAVYIYTAPEEDYGKGMVEAMAAAVPVVAWNNAGPTGIVKDGKTGFLAKPFEVNDLAEKILRLLTDKKLNRKMGQAGRDLVAAKFTKHHHQKKLEEEIKRAKKATV